MAIAHADVIVVGSYNQDCVWHLPTLPKPGETRLGSFDSMPGGKGFNQAVAAHRLCAKTCFVGAVGEDANGATAKRIANHLGLDCAWESVRDTATGTAAVLLDGHGANLIAVAPGANTRLSTSFIETHSHAIANARIVVCQLEVDLRATACALDLAKLHRATTLLNPAPINDDFSSELLRLADVLTPNESEFAFLLGKIRGWKLDSEIRDCSDQELHDLCRQLSSNAVIVTLGGAGYFVSTPQAFHRGTAERAETIDTTGAGDAFTGALAAGLVHYGGLPALSAAAHFANRAAALSTERKGTTCAMPSLEELENRFGAINA